MDFLWMFLGGMLASPAQAEMLPTSVAEISTPSANPGSADPLLVNDAGFVFKNALQPEAGALNTGTVVQQQITSETTVQENGTEYVDHCGKGKKAKGYAHTTGIGTTFVSSRAVTPRLAGKAGAQGWFISRRTPPSPGLRVVVRNASLAQSIEQMPYTDREYNKGSRSERFNAALGDGHESKYMAMQSGKNRFVYQIKRGDQVVDSGEFVATIAVALQDISQTFTLSRSKEYLHCERNDDRKDRYDRKDRHDDKDRPRKNR